MSTLVTMLTHWKDWNFCVNKFICYEVGNKELLHCKYGIETKFENIFLFCAII